MTSPAGAMSKAARENWPCSFGYHATLLSPSEAESASTSPSPSTSVVNTEKAMSAAVVMA